MRVDVQPLEIARVVDFGADAAGITIILDVSVQVAREPVPPRRVGFEGSDDPFYFIRVDTGIVRRHPDDDIRAHGFGGHVIAVREVVGVSADHDRRNIETVGSIDQRRAVLLRGDRQHNLAPSVSYAAKHMPHDRLSLE